MEATSFQTKQIEGESTVSLEFLNALFGFVGLNPRRPIRPREEFQWPEHDIKDVPPRLNPRQHGAPRPPPPPYSAATPSCSAHPVVPSTVDKRVNSHTPVVPPSHRSNSRSAASHSHYGQKPAHCGLKRSEPSADENRNSSERPAKVQKLSGHHSHTTGKIIPLKQTPTSNKAAKGSSDHTGGDRRPSNSTGGPKGSYHSTGGPKPMYPTGVPSMPATQFKIPKLSVDRPVNNAGPMTSQRQTPASKNVAKGTSAPYDERKGSSHHTAGPKPMYPTGVPKSENKAGQVTPHRQTPASNKTDKRTSAPCGEPKRSSNSAGGPKGSFHHTGGSKPMYPTDVPTMPTTQFKIPKLSVDKLENKAGHVTPHRQTHASNKTDKRTSAPCGEPKGSSNSAGGPKGSSHHTAGPKPTYPTGVPSMSAMQFKIPKLSVHKLENKAEQVTPQRQTPLSNKTDKRIFAPCGGPKGSSNSAGGPKGSSNHTGGPKPMYPTGVPSMPSKQFKIPKLSVDRPENKAGQVTPLRQTPASKNVAKGTSAPCGGPKGSSNSASGPKGSSHPTVGPKPMYPTGVPSMSVMQFKIPKLSVDRPEIKLACSQQPTTAAITSRKRSYSSMETGHRHR